MTFWNQHVALTPFWHKKTCRTGLTIGDMILITTGLGGKSRLHISSARWYKYDKCHCFEIGLMSSTPPIAVTREKSMLVQQLLNKHGIEIYFHHMNRSYYDYDKIGLQLRLTT
jgi:hypothetical protein